MLSAKLRTALAKPFMPALFFFSGVTYDTLTLTRIDRLLDNLVLLLYLSLLGVLIVLTARADLAGQAESPAEHTTWWPRLLALGRPYYPMAIQFLLGGLFSAYAIFYSQSASLTATAVFFGLLVALLVGNEFLHDRLSNLRLLVTLYAVVCFSFFTFFLPVLTGLMNTAVFLLGAALSAGVALRVVQLVYRGGPARPRKETVLAGLPAMTVIGVENRGPIGTFESRIDMAFMLGLISENERRILNLIRKIRNEFSHSAEHIDFESSRVKDMCLSLDEMPKTAKAIFGRPIDFSDPVTRFIVSAICLALIFNERKKEISRREKRQPITDDQIAPLAQKLT